ncbi:MAG: hypothetical protein ACYCU7_18315 [Acidimicrobiales bacterium]
MAELAAMASHEGVDVEELVARLLVEALPDMVAELSGRWLRATLGLAWPVDVPGIRKGRPDDGHMVPELTKGPGPEPGSLSESLSPSSPTASVARSAIDPKRTCGACSSAD